MVHTHSGSDESAHNRRASQAALRGVRRDPTRLPMPWGHQIETKVVPGTGESVVASMAWLPILI